MSHRRVAATLALLLPLGLVPWSGPSAASSSASASVDELPTNVSFRVTSRQRVRLEEDGVLRSWAVPKGLPDDTGHDRLAVAVDDHDLDHVDFEDDHKSIADDGTWEEHDRNERRLVFSLHGRADVRRYALIHTGGTQWLLHLTKGQPGS